MYQDPGTIVTDHFNQAGMEKNLQYLTTTGCGEKIFTLQLV